MLVEALKTWCEREVLDASHAFMLVINKDLEEVEIEEGANTVKCLGRVLIRGRKPDAQNNRWMALCVCKETVESPSVPLEFMPPGQEQPWLLITNYSTAPEPKGFSDRLQDFLSAEKKTMDDLQTILGNTGTSPESIIRAMGEL